MTISGHRGVKSAEIKHNIKIPFKNIKTRVHYRNFGLSKTIRSLIKKHIVGKNWLLIPLEKNLFHYYFTHFYLKYSLRTSQPFKIFSYNHDLSRSNSNLVWKIFWRLVFSMYDVLIYYSEQGLDYMLKNNYVKKDKAFYLNNVIFSKEVYDNYNFSYPGKESLSLLFISRLYNSKDIPTLFNYFDILKKKLKKKKSSYIKYNWRWSTKRFCH